MILRARENLRQARFNRAAAISGSSLSTIDSAISGAVTAGQTSVEVPVPLPSDVAYLKDQGYEVVNDAGDPTKIKISWETPTDSGPDF